MLIYRLRNQAQYLQHIERQRDVLERRRLAITQLELDNRDQTFSVPGFSITAEQNVKFIVDWQHSFANHINWRERLVCPITGLNNRQRASYHIYLTELRPYPDDRTYITEKVTHFFQFMDTKVVDLIGSEYVDPSFASGDFNEQGIRHEDLTALSFADESLDKVISFDCLEHIPDYQSALAECFRVLKPDGLMLISFPFNTNTFDTLVRATVDDAGNVTHICDPEYHGDPLSNEGCLSYYTFGWDVIEHMKKIGFKDVYAVVYWSDVFGYLGEEQIAFVAHK
jgi:SAM-dependent methyltransferase